jgi:putative peptidoglycan lipid II flippase
MTDRLMDDNTGQPDSESRQMVNNALAVAFWTVVSRVTGFVRAVVIAAILGPTYLGNTYQATNSIPNLTFYFLTGSLFVTLLVPPLIAHIDLDENEAGERLAGGFLGTAMAVLGTVAAVIVLGGPLILGLLSSGVANPTIAAAQLRVGWILIAVFMPQVLLYAVAGTSAAVLNAHGRFALAAAAPALENLGIITTLIASALFFGTGTTLASVQAPQLLLLGLGTTGAVAAHAAAVWLGTYRLGVRLIPHAGWRDHELRGLHRRAVSSVGYAGLEALGMFAALVVANSVRGGVVAFQVAIQFSYMAFAVGAQPIAVALLPRLSRLHEQGKKRGFRDELVHGVSLTFFVTVPVSLALIVLAFPLARAVSFGEMGRGTGVVLISASLATVALSLLGRSGRYVCTQTFYAQHDVRTPLRGMIVRTVASVGLMVPILLWTDGWITLALLGAAVTLGEVTSAGYLAQRLKSKLGSGRERLGPPFFRALAAAALMIGPAYLVTMRLMNELTGQLSELISVLAGAALGATLFLGVQSAWRSPELTDFVKGIRTATNTSGTSQRIRTESLTLPGEPTDDNETRTWAKE